MLLIENKAEYKAMNFYGKYAQKMLSDVNMNLKHFFQNITFLFWKMGCETLSYG